jgi:hypothetical protein
MTRREMALVGGALAAARKSAKGQPAMKYRSALDGLEGKVDSASFDPIAYTLTLHDAAPLALTCAAVMMRGVVR